MDPGLEISIHALLAESDQSLNLPSRPMDISIHALLAESDVIKKAITFHPPVFLSTLSLRRATIQLEFNSLESKHFYPRSPCGERPCMTDGSICFDSISIHALLAESDSLHSINYMIHTHFYPRSPCGERQPALYQLYDTYAFLSTLSLRRATWYACSIVQTAKNFYPRSPCGERP